MTDDTHDGPNDTESGDDRVDPEPPTGMDDDAPALTPDELDIADSEYVEELSDDGRYVVSPGGGPPNVPDSETGDGGEKQRRSGGDEGARARTSEPGSDRRRSDPAAGSQRPASPEAARTLLAKELERSRARYGLDIVARFEGETVRHRTVADDVIGTFEDLVRWYAGHVTDGTPPDEVVDILLRESSFETDETPNLAKLLRTHGLDRTDSIDDLVSAIREEADGG